MDHYERLRWVDQLSSINRRLNESTEDDALG